MLLALIRGLSLASPIVYINNFNYLTWPKQMAEYVHEVFKLKVIIVDNNSTYPPLLEWYNNCPFRVLRLNQNLRQYGPWLSGAISFYSKNDHYIVTDPDLDLSGCPADAIDVLFKGLDKYRNYITEYDRVPIIKAGLSLFVDDLAYSDSPVAQEAYKYEKGLVDGKKEGDFYKVPVDTTFALYKPITPNFSYTISGVRAASPYDCRHLPWYLDKNNLTDEQKYYKETADLNVSSWYRKL